LPICGRNFCAHYKENFKKVFREKRNAGSEYLLPREQGSRTDNYILFEEGMEKEFQKIKEYDCRIKTDPSFLKELTKNPEKYIDPELIDLDLFSERVIGLGVFKPIKVPYIQTADIDWWGRVILGDSDEEESAIKWLDKETAEKLNSLINDAVENNLSIINWNGIEVPLDEAKSKLDQYNKVTEANKQNNDIPDNEKLDLIAKHNIDEMEYDGHQILPDFGKLSFEPLKESDCSVPLKPYQQDGVAWLQALWDNKTYGGLLADDMGLGKTLQVLYFLEWLLEKNTDKNTTPLKILIIAPKSLLQNWCEEYDKFFPSGNYMFMKDNNLDEFLKVSENSHFHVRGYVHLCTYQTLTRKTIEYGRIDWDTVITDEAQYAKTPGNRITNALQTLKTKFKISMTGTPVENSFQELWNIIEYLNPGYLGTLKDFNRKYRVDRSNTAEEINNLARELREKINPILLRRTKDGVLKDELPEKIIHDTHIDNNPDLPIEIEFTESQRNEYLDVLRAAKRNYSRGKALSEINKLKIVSDHPRLFSINKNFYTGRFTEEIAKESARIHAVELILDMIKEKNEKVLIFAELKRTQYMLQSWIKERYNIHTKIINGESPVKYKSSYTGFKKQAIFDDENASRQEITKIFNNLEGFNVLILSPIAAGVGLNITGANHVIHFSRHWNPAKEDQATDRAYRIGQKKDVHVYLPKAVAPDFKTFDINVAMILDRKRKIASETLYPTNIMDNESDFDIFLKNSIVE